MRHINNMITFIFVTLLLLNNEFVISITLKVQVAHFSNNGCYLCKSAAGCSSFFTTDSIEQIVQVFVIGMNSAFVTK